MASENFLVRWWRRRQRAIDVDVLWPQLLDEYGGSRPHAQVVFRLHMEIDPAYAGMDEQDTDAFLEQLP